MLCQIDSLSAIRAGAEILPVVGGDVFRGVAKWCGVAAELADVDGADVFVGYEIGGVGEIELEATTCDGEEDPWGGRVDRFFAAGEEIVVVGWEDGAVHCCVDFGFERWPGEINGRGKGP